MVRSALGKDAFSAAYARGRAATSEQIVADMMAREVPNWAANRAAGRLADGTH